MSWRSIHFHDRDPWTGVIKETVWEWMTDDKYNKRNRYLVCIKSPDGKIFKPDYGIYLYKPSDVKDYIETVILKKPRKLPSKVIKHIDADDINFGVLIRELHKRSPVNYRDICDVFKSLKIDIQIFKMLNDLDVAEYIVGLEGECSTWMIKDPQEIYGEKDVG